MKILKFGGTSVGKPERMKSIADIINDGSDKIVVLSAVSGTTNALVEISALSLKNDFEGAKAKAQELYNKYVPFVANLYSTEEGKTKGTAIIDEHFGLIKSNIKEGFSSVEENETRDDIIKITDKFIKTKTHNNIIRKILNQEINEENKHHWYL